MLLCTLGFVIVAVFRCKLNIKIKQGSRTKGLFGQEIGVQRIKLDFLLSLFLVQNLGVIKKTFESKSSPVTGFSLGLDVWAVICQFL